jgi:DNA (cytosine-5)-methyltransferase 1
MLEIQNFLDRILESSNQALASQGAMSGSITEDLKSNLDEILKRSESSKGVLTVVITSAVYKHFHPEQDIRNHQSSIPNGYSGRTFDVLYITPFLKRHRFPAMADSGWLTRSLEQKVPYDQNYTGAITPKTLKSAFLSTLEAIESGVNCEELLQYLFQGLLIQRDKIEVDLAKPVNLPISTIISLLEQHFSEKYRSEGASRLPVLAIYAVYKCLISEAKRFEGKVLAPIESHTTADKRSGRIGDIEVTQEDGEPYEAVEVKHSIPLSAQLLRDAFEKFSKTQVDRYYLLSTKEAIDQKENVQILREIERIKNIHGCQVIVNGVVKTLHYYLRLVANPATFMHHYVTLVEQDKSLKFEHKQHWNDLVAGQQ